MQRMAKKSDKYIPLYFVAFFAVIFVVDGIFVYMATSTHRGVVTDRAYQKGVDYNHTVAAEKSQRLLGWQGQIKLNDKALHFTLHDANDAPISDARVDVHLFRPTQAGMDRTIPLEAMGDGSYNTTLDLPLKGQWDARISATWKQQSYQIHKRIVLK